jgi:hypothetical protein
MTNHQKILQANLRNRLLEIRSKPGMLNSIWVAVGYLVLLALAESLIALGSIQAGLILDSLVLVGLLLHASLTTKPSLSLFLLGLSLAPLIRLLSLILPLALFPTIFWYLIVGVPMFVAVFLIIRFSGLSWRKVGLTAGNLPVQLLVGLTGFIFGYVEYMILRPSPLVSAYRWELIGLSALILFIFTGFLEELTFRGLMQSTSVPYLGIYALPYIAIVFAVLHLGNRSTLEFFFVLGVALFFGWVVQRSGSILGVTLAHGLTNITLYLIVPFMLAIPATAGVGGAIQPGFPFLPPTPTSSLSGLQGEAMPGLITTTPVRGNLTPTLNPPFIPRPIATSFFSHWPPFFIQPPSLTPDQPQPGHASPTATPTMTASLSPTATSTPTLTPTATPTMTVSRTPTPTRTPTLTPADTATETLTDTPTRTPTDTATEVPTDTATEVPTDTATEVPTDTPALIPTDTPVPSDMPTDIPTEIPSEITP